MFRNLIATNVLCMNTTVTLKKKKCITINEKRI